MSKPYNPQDGSKYVYLLSKSITDRGDKMTGTFRGGKTKHKMKHKSIHKTISKKKRYRYTNETTHVHKKQHTLKRKYTRRRR
jgi:hypothetical protein